MLAVAHYGAALFVAFLMRFHGTKPGSDVLHAGLPPLAPLASGRRKSLVLRAFQAMHHARVQDGRPFGQLLQQAIQSSLRLVFVIGGLVVFFSVFLELLSQAHLLTLLTRTVQSLLSLFGVSAELTQSVVSGFFEVTLGAKSAGQAGDSLPLVSRAAIAAFVLSWAGLSVHAQIMSLIHHTGMRYAPFIIARAIHAVVAAALVYICWNWLSPARETVSGLLQPLQQAITAPHAGVDAAARLPISLSPEWLGLWSLPAILFGMSICMVTVIYIVYRCCKLFRQSP